MLKEKTAVKKEELDSLLKLAIKKVEQVGIELEKPIISTVRTYPAKSYFGQCRYDGELDMFRITISDYHLPNGYKAVMNTLLHEVIHACKGSRGHGSQWKEYADIVNREYGYEISRLFTSNNYDLHVPKSDKREKVKYIIECEKCGAIWERVRKSKLVTQTKYYRCGGGCDGKLKRIK